MHICDIVQYVNLKYIILNKWKCYSAHYIIFGIVFN